MSSIRQKAVAEGLSRKLATTNTAGRFERPRNDVGMREQQPALPGAYHKWKWRCFPRSCQPHTSQLLEDEVTTVLKANKVVRMEARAANAN